MASAESLFSEAWYGSLYPDVVAAGVPGLVHYLEHGWLEGRSPHPLFSSKWFRSMWADRPDDQSDLAQYLLFKSPSSVSPHPAIDEEWYRTTYVASSELTITAAEHYVRVGARQGNSTSDRCSAIAIQKIEHRVRAAQCK